MTGYVESRLESHADSEVVRRLHDVPPYEVYEVRVDGRRAVCKLDAHPEGDAATEGWVTDYVARTTSLPVPSVLAVGGDYFVVEWLDAVPEERGDDEESDLDGWLRGAGAGLATLHEETPFDATGLPRADDGFAVETHETWADTVVAFLARRREYLAGVGYADVADAAIEFVEEHPAAFDVPGDPVLCHGNYLPDHVGVERGEAPRASNDASGDVASTGEVTALIDFEHALVAPGEYDYWRTALPTFLGPEGAGADAERTFRAGYESVRPLPEGFDDRRKLYLTMNTVAYVRSLFLQDQHDPDEAERRAGRMREHVYDSLDELEGELG